MIRLERHAYEWEQIGSRRVATDWFEPPHPEAKRLRVEWVEIPNLVYVTWQVPGP